MFSVARIPVDSGEPVRRKWQPADCIVTVCLLPLLVFDVPQWVFIFVADHLGAGVYIPCLWPGINP